jgi:hypothetical protein
MAHGERCFEVGMGPVEDRHRSQRRYRLTSNSAIGGFIQTDGRWSFPSTAKGIPWGELVQDLARRLEMFENLIAPADLTTP